MPLEASKIRLCSFVATSCLYGVVIEL